MVNEDDYKTGSRPVWMQVSCYIVLLFSLVVDTVKQLTNLMPAKILSN